MVLSGLEFHGVDDFPVLRSCCENEDGRSEGSVRDCGRSHSQRFTLRISNVQHPDTSNITSTDPMQRFLVESTNGAYLVWPLNSN